MAPSIYVNDIKKHNNKSFGGKQLRMKNRCGVDTTKHVNGQCPYGFAKFYFNNGYSLQTANQKSQFAEKVNIFNCGLSYSHRTNVLNFTANVTWSIDGGQTWQKLHDT